jgi:hypothetical protein
VSEGLIEEEYTEFFDKLTANVKDERKKRKISQLKLSNILGHNSTIIPQENKTKSRITF